MSEWNNGVIGDLGTIITGKTPSTKKPEYWNGTIPFVTPKDIQSNKHIVHTERYVTTEGENSVKGAIIPEGAICVSCIGNIGYVGITTEECISNQQINSIIVKDGFDRNYVYYLMKSLWKAFKHYEGQSTALSILNKTQFSKINVRIPGLEIQRKIGRILSAIDDKIEINICINQNLEQQAQALFKSWFVDYEPFGGQKPNDWKCIQFKDILTPSTVKSDDDSIPMFSVTDTGLYPRDKKFKKSLSMQNTKCKIIIKNDLIFGMSRKILNWGVMHDPIGRVSPAYNVYHLDSKINSYYLESYIKANILYFKDLIRPASREGQGIDKNLLMKKFIDIPPDSVLTNYYALETPLISYAHFLLKENDKLSLLRDTLLPQLISGKLDVSHIDI